MITKNMIIVIAGIVLAVGAAIIFMLQQKPLPVQPPPGNSGQSNNVSIENFSFNPATLTVKSGATVVWTNNDSVAHTIKSDNFNSQSLSKGQTFEFKFDNKGSYDYFCGLHPTMKGKIVVE